MPNKVPFTKGINFTKWFEFRTFEGIDFNKFTEKDFIDAKTLGADVIRVPVPFHNFLINKNNKIEPKLFAYLDEVAAWAVKNQIYLIIDNHSFHPVNSTDPKIEKILIPVWEQIARHFKDYGEYIIYEVLNEPHGIPDEIWNKIQGNAIKAIRKHDKKHSIIVGGTNYNSIEKMLKVPAYKDNNLIYTFHFYDPHLFTHQGASWNSPSLEPLKDLPFPAAEGFSTSIHESFKGTWVEEALKYYEHDSKLTKLSETLQKAADFSKERDVPVFCGEFGVYMLQCPSNDRAKWYKFVCEELLKLNISWTCWDYFGGFGIFKTMQRGDFPADLDFNITKAMGFKTE